MEILRETPITTRYEIVTEAKSGGAIYTPRALADFVAQQIVQAAEEYTTGPSIRILDPAVGHGQLLISLLEQLRYERRAEIEVYGFETDVEALGTARERLEQTFPDASLVFESTSFLHFVLEHFEPGGSRNLFQGPIPGAFDLVIANPPYVRTQILGAKQARLLSKQFNLAGRIDLYYAFVLGISQVLKPQGIAGVIVSNRFMTTKSGAAVRRALLDRFHLRHAWDLGDTKLFKAAVLPAVLLAQGKNGEKRNPPAFTSIYETSKPATTSVPDAISALDIEGVAKTDDGRHFHVQHGTIATNGTRDGVWRVATAASNTWLSIVEAHTWKHFRNIGKIRVGVKTCADKVFIRNDWEEMADNDRPELLRPITTHQIARRFKSLVADQPRHVLYPHEVVQGRRRAVDLTRYPRSLAYLNTHRQALEGRRYVIEAGRQWYEIWVPQDPCAWAKPKLVFRDIADQPTFWIDLDGSVINGDCYWLVPKNPADMHLLWLALAVANSTFVERFYDIRFHNKLYAGRRRFMTQYVENFPLPEPDSVLGQSIIATAELIHQNTPSPLSDSLQQELDSMVWRALTGAAPPSG